MKSKLVAFRRLAPVAAAAFLLCTSPVQLPAQQSPAKTHPHASHHSTAASGEPVHLTAAQDRERTLRLMGIRDSQMRPRPSSTGVHARHEANYNEAKANVYPTLPNPLVLNDGKPVTTAKMWWKQRRPQIVGHGVAEALQLAVLVLQVALQLGPGGRHHTVTGAGFRYRQRRNDIVGSHGGRRVVP